MPNRPYPVAPPLPSLGGNFGVNQSQAAMSWDLEGRVQPGVASGSRVSDYG